MKKVLNVLACSLLVVFMASCQSKEDRVIEQMNALADRIENQTESFTDEEWEAIDAEFESLKSLAETCNFNSEQKEAYAKAKTEVITARTKKKATDLYDDGKSVVKGIFNGLKEGLGLEEKTPAETE